MRLEQAYISDQDYYEALDLAADATCHEVTAAYEKLANELDLHHPIQSQRVLAAEKMLKLTQAYEILNNPIQRSRYDLYTFGNEPLPVSESVHNLFLEAVRAFRKRKSDLALRYFKEIATLYPHRSLYRVHLAISYADKKWITFSEVELETALKLDPNSDFAKETVAKLLFKLPDRTKKRAGFELGLNRKVVALASIVLLFGVLLASGLPQMILGSTLSFVRNILDPDSQIQAANPERGLPKDMVAELRKKKSKANYSSVVLTKFDDKFIPDQPVYDYTKYEAEQKTYYADQNMVVITYKDGSILTYKPHELKGWKMHKGSAVMITREHEMIPAPASVPLLLGDGSPVDMKEDGFPVHLFPEYGGAPSASNSEAASTPEPQAVESAPETVEVEPDPDPTPVPTLRPQKPSTYSPYNVNPTGTR